MATYFSGSNIQADTMQTLYLMNPDYVGYQEMPASGNMVLVNPSTGATLTNNNLVASGQPQQHFISIPFPPAPLPQRPSMGTVENSSGTHQGIPSMSLPSRLGNNGYSAWRNMGNELTTMRANEPSHNENQAFSGQANSFSYMGHQCVSEISPTGMKHTPISSMPEQHLSMNPNGLGLQLDKSHNSTANGQGLSLSLSPHQLSSMQLSCFQNQPTDSEVNCPGISQANSEENMNNTDRITSKWPGNLSSFQDSARDGMLSGKFLSSPGGPEAIKQNHYGYNAIGATEVANGLTGSKYFKATIQLLEEVVNVGKGIKPDIAKHQKPQTWFGTVVDKKNNSTETSTNDGTQSAITGPSTSTQEVKNEHGVGLTAADRQELQMKKAKLVAMLDEVDRRYRQYYHQLQIVVSTFEVAAGFGAAKTYTALALQRISRHFRSLRDAIAGQIRLTSKNLGEEDLISNGKSETTRLRFVDQQLRQQRALQQLGMIQQHAWRPQRGLPERAVSILRAWLFEHFLHPYPKDADKHLLARQTGLTRSQVSNWFINARVRLWKPMVEEMYLEETKEVEAETQKEDSRITEGAKSKEETDLKGGGGTSENEQEQKNAKSNRLDDHTEKQGFMQQNGSLNGVFKSCQDTNSINGRNQTINMDNGSNNHVFHEIPNEAVKKARNKIQDLTAFLPSNVTMDVDLKSGETEGEYVLDNSKFGSDERHASEGYNLLNNKMFHHDTNGNFGSYQFEGLSKYGHESFTPKFSGIGGGVSLTLGLQHCDDLSLSGTQQSYGSSQGLGLGRRHHLGSNSDDYCSINDTPAAHGTSNYENIAMQNRKRFATHSLHDFVA